MTYPNALVDAFQRRGVILFAGAGVSVNARLPGWTGLVKPLALSVGVPWPAAEADVTSVHLLAGVQHYENQNGRNALVRYLRGKLDTAAILPSAAHLLLTLLPVPTIFTTNYDDLLERAYRETGRPAGIVIRESELAYLEEGIPQVIKLCGDLAQPESLVITRADFNTYPDTHARILAYLAAMLETRTVLFLGYGLNDPFLNQVWDGISLAFGAHRRLGYSVVFDAPALELDDLRRRGVQPINLASDGRDKTTLFTEWLIGLVDSLSITLEPGILSALSRNAVDGALMARLRTMNGK